MFRLATFPPPSYFFLITRRDGRTTKETFWIFIVSFSFIIHIASRNCRLFLSPAWTRITAWLSNKVRVNFSPWIYWVGNLGAPEKRRHVKLRLKVFSVMPKYLDWSLQSPRGQLYSYTNGNFFRSVDFLDRSSLLTEISSQFCNKHQALAPASYYPPPLNNVFNRFFILPIRRRHHVLIIEYYGLRFIIWCR